MKNSGKYPVLEINYLQYPDLADNIWHAQMSEHPQILTYAGSDPGRRKEAMTIVDGNTTSQVPRILSRDEYPFACTLEGGRSTAIGHIPARQNSSQGGLISSFIRQNGISPNCGELSKFIVKVTNHPKGEVTVPLSGKEK
ncbi:MAG: hypothetical protein IPJ66_04505 [Bacteroidetes bacterium]|nr:hypothetical protein [Bacteroidota bacterium]MBL0066432.1 hypothetical protein [Bacteroidota bacterium]MBL0138916.1 hypothetical protein [Bacteroidota bacterium]